MPAPQAINRIMAILAERHTIVPVSYTHLDVYKRQVLDNVEDKIDLSQGHLFGFDDTAFLEDKDILAPVTMYLLHVTESLIDGRRFIYVMAEFWKRLALPEFTDFAVNKQFTIRKQNGFGIFDTQSPAQILKTPHVAAMVEQCATQIFLPNPKADYHDYVEGFKVTEMEYHTCLLYTSIKT